MNTKSLIPSIFISIAFLVIFILILPNINRISDLKSAIAVRETMLNEQEATLKRIDSLYAGFEENITDIEKISNIIPKTKNIAELTSAINAIASQSGMVVTSMDFSTITKPGETRYKIAFEDIRLRGKYPDFVEFLSLLEQSIRISDVTSIDISPAQGLSGEEFLTFGLRINSYFLNE